MLQAPNGEQREDKFFEDLKIQSFDRIVENTKFHVYGLSGKWGSGKSTFIKFWEDYVKTKSDKYSIVHVDAFSKDYSEDPFSMLFGTIKEFMKQNGIAKEDTAKLIEKAKKVGFALMKAVGYGLIQRYTNGIAKDILETFNSELEYDPIPEEKDPIDELREELSNIIKKINKALYIVVDELDRCRPDFALETLEKIKHIFSLEGIKIVLVYNPSIICGIVKNRYGCDENDARTYIHKFVEKEIPFSIDLRNTLAGFIRYETSFYCSGDESIINSIKYVSNAADSIADILIDYEKTSLREVQRLIPSIMDSIQKAGSWSQSRWFWLTISLLVMTDVSEYNGIVSYLSLNKTLSMNTPKRSSYLKIAHHLSGIAEESDLIRVLESTFKEEREKF